MSLDPPTYLNSLQNNIRARPIPWEGAVRAGFITDNDLKTIKAVDKVRKEQRKQTVESDVEAYQSLILGGSRGKSVLESASKRTDVIQYMLVLTDDLINDAPSLSKSLLSHPSPYKPLVPYLTHSTNPEDPIPLLASSVLTSLLSASQQQSAKSNPQTDEALAKLYTYLSTLTKSQDSGLQDIAVQEYSSLLQTKKAREIFWKQREETVNPLIDILRAAVGAGRDSDSTLFNGGSSIRSATEAGLSGGVGLQLLYHVLLPIWQLSFEASLIGKGLEKEQEIIPLYGQLLRLSPKEKTTRLLLSTLLNLLSATSNKSTLLPAATTARLPAVLSNLKGRHLTDPDLLEDLKALTEMLDDYTSSQTTFDEYAAEVQSGHLRWSPPHRDATFWVENARKILDDDGSALPKKLKEIMGKAWEDEKQVLAIACNDVGWLVRQAPEKRSVLEKLGVKARIMELMTDSDEAVRWESLRAVGEWLRYSFDD
ncbi:H(+)-transporting V1 sector ATPase subunit H [Lecanora helva]